MCFAELLLLSPLLPLDFLLSLVAIALREGHASPESGSGVRAAAGCSFGAVFSLPPPIAERLLELEVVFPEVAGCGVGIGLLLLKKGRRGKSVPCATAISSVIWRSMISIHKDNSFF